MKKLICLLLMAAHLAGCATYVNKSITFRSPKGYANYQNAYGIMVGAESFANSKETDDAFGFDLRAAGLLPIQIVIDNKSGQGVEVVSGQTFLIDNANRYWKVLSNRDAVERVQKATAGNAPAGETGKGTPYSAAVKSLLAYAIKIFSGREVASLAKGRVLGDPSAKGADDRQRDAKIADDIRDKGVEGKIMSAESLASGYIFFPADVPSASELRLQVKFRGDGRLQTINLKLK